MANTRYRAQLDKIDEFINIYNLPRDLSDDLRRTNKELWQIHKGIDMNAVVDELPRSLQTRTRMVRSCSSFRLVAELGRTAASAQQARQPSAVVQEVQQRVLGGALHAQPLRSDPFIARMTAQTLVSCLSTEVYLKDEYIFRQGTVSSCMYFLSKGACQVRACLASLSQVSPFLNRRLAWTLRLAK